MSRPTPTSRAAARLLALGVLCALATAGLFRVAVHTTAGQRWDERLRGGVDAGQARIHEAGSDLLQTISVSSLALVGALIVAIALVRRRPRLAIGAGVVVLGSNVTVQVMKGALERPPLGDTWWNGPNSFPSGHATVAMSLAMAVILVAPPALRVPMAVIGGAYALGVGVAVIALDWHRPSDVLGAYLVVTAWTGLVAAALAHWPDRGTARRRDDDRARAWGLGLAAVLAATIAIAAVRAATEPDVAALAMDRTGLVAAGIVCSLVGGVLLAAVAMLTGGRPVPSRRRPRHM